jgi:hypothetical protein
MSQKFAIKFETGSDERRDRFIKDLIEVLNNVITGGDKASIVFSDERPTFRGKENRTITTNWEDGQEPPTLWEIGIRNTQHDMFGGILSGLAASRSADTDDTTSTTVVEDGAGEDAGQDLEQTDDQPASGEQVFDQYGMAPDVTPDEDADRPSATFDKDLDPFRRYLDGDDTAETNQTDDTDDQQQEG